MAFHFSPYAWLLIGNAGLAVSIAYLAYRHRTRTARWLFWMATALAWWSLMYGLHVAGANFTTQYFFNCIKYLGTMFVPPLWFLVAHSHTRPTNPLSPRKTALILLSTTVFLPLVLLDPVLHTWWPQITPVHLENGLLFLEATHSAFYYFYTLIAFGWVLAGLGLFVQHYHRFPARRSQTRWLILAGLLPFLANVLTQLNLSPLPWGLDPFVFTFSLTFLAIAILRERFLDPVPLAYSQIIAHLPIGVVILDQAQQVAEINPAARRFCNLTTPRPHGQPLDQVIGDPTLREAMLTALRREDDPSPEVTLAAQDRMVEVQAAPIKHEGEHLGWVLTITDITEHKQMEEELAKARDVAVAASALKSRLLASASQDMRHPAGMLIGYLEALLAGAYGPLGGDQKEILADALVSASRLLGFLQNLKGYAELESGTMFQIAPFTPEALFQTVRPVAEAIAQAKGLQLTWEVDPALPKTLFGDLHWLGHVLNNLLNNALTYTDRGGHIRVRLYPVDNEAWALEVQDNGRGMTFQQQKHLFDLNQSKGLGLIVTRGVVERMGGHLHFTSALGRGTTFTVVLPLRPEGMAAPKEA